ncbi:UNVERIFIED_ORG: hypothetical protein FNL38_104425 [Nocardia globerula]|uniref:Uncharacterized protein n=1 Tax=Nocardia globerula TaxID=1818 RepID=A0A652YPK2_NOCGL|nr:hypothetical protein [Rhodococcus globerulus]NMD62712.1 hypothetical protein [Nocardia globerula]PVX68165.1 hypothetical protein C8E04_5545 [Rhodococcus globerulus]
MSTSKASSEEFRTIVSIPKRGVFDAIAVAAYIERDEHGDEIDRVVMLNEITIPCDGVDDLIVALAEARDSVDGLHLTIDSLQGVVREMARRAEGDE